MVRRIEHSITHMTPFRNSCSSTIPRSVCSFIRRFHHHVSFGKGDSSPPICSGERDQAISQKARYEQVIPTKASYDHLSKGMDATSRSSGSSHQPRPPTVPENAIMKELMVQHSFSGLAEDFL